MTPANFVVFFFLVATLGIIKSVLENADTKDSRPNALTVKSASFSVPLPANGTVPGERGLASLGELPRVAVVPVPTMDAIDTEPMMDSSRVEEPIESLPGPVDPQQWIVTESQISDWD